MRPRRSRAGSASSSIGLARAAAILPAAMARMEGMQGYDPVLRLFGLREIATGIGILAGPGPASGWLWARVAGDALDLALLGNAAATNPAGRERIPIAAGAVAGVMLADIACAQRLGSDS